jgi:hypothetical protein
MFSITAQGEMCGHVQRTAERERNVAADVIQEHRPAKSSLLQRDLKQLIVL